MTWYVVHTHAGAEGLARRNLDRQGFPCYLPQYLKRRRHARRVDQVPAPLFPRYAFVSIDLQKQRWQSIQSTIGVRYLICADGRPQPVPDQIIAELQTREDARGLIDMVRQSPFRSGERVQVTEGALIDQVGIFETSSGTERAIILLRLLGRDLRVTVPQMALSRAA